MVGWIAALGLSLAPLLSLHHTGPQEVNRVRDFWLLGVLAVTLVYTLEHAWLFAPLAAWFLLRWRTVDVLPSVTTWVAIGATWQLAKSVPVDLVRWLPIAWLVIACALSVLLIVQRVWGEDLRTQKESFGWLGQRTFAGASLALVLPFAPWWLWPLLGTGLFLTGPPWLAVGAILTGELVLQARLGLIVVPGAIVALWAWKQGWLNFTPRGDGIDGLEQRANKYRLMLRHLTWQGHGPHTLTRQLLRWNSQYSTPEQREPLPLGNAHNDYLELVWDYGLAGGLLILLAGVDISSRLRWGDPWSAAAVVAAVLALGSYPCRVAPVGLVMLTIWAMVGLR